MGSFNVQCVASKMRISHYDEVIVFPLFKYKEPSGSVKVILNIKEEFEKLPENKKQYLLKYGGDTYTNPSEKAEFNIPKENVNAIYPGETWQIGLPIIAKYNDYGGFELEDKHSDQIAAQLFIRLIKNSALPISKANYEYARVNFEPKNLSGAPDKQNDDIKEILNVQQDSLLFVCNDNSIEYKNSHNSYRQVALSYMDKKVYDLMMNRFKADREEIYKQIDDHIAIIPQYLAAEKAYYTSDREDKEKRQELLSKYHELEDKVKIRRLNSEYENSFQCYYRNTYFDFNNHMDMHPETKEMSWNPVKLETYTKLLKAKADAYIANLFMDVVLNESWTPVKYTGQNHSNQNRIAFNEAVNKIAKDKYNEYFGEDEPKSRKKKIK
jgi:hypothetical protein